MRNENEKKIDLSMSDELRIEQDKSEFKPSSQHAPKPRDINSKLDKGISGYAVVKYNSGNMGVMIIKEGVSINDDKNFDRCIVFDGLYYNLKEANEALRVIENCICDTCQGKRRIFKRAFGEPKETRSKPDHYYKPGPPPKKRKGQQAQAPQPKDNGVISTGTNFVVLIKPDSEVGYIGPFGGPEEPKEEEPK